MPTHCEIQAQLGYRRRQVWSRGKIYDHAGMGDGYSGSVLESQSPIFLQAMGRRAEDAKRAGRMLEGRTWDEMPVNMGLVKL